MLTARNRRMPDKEVLRRERAILRTPRGVELKGNMRAYILT
jgi:hypothetical protein